MHLIIIGAPRSGTNMLRDALTALPGLGTWPCDEINYIWRHGNVRHRSDAFSPDLARPEVKAYIRKRFSKMQARLDTPVLVEKTCANALRVGFVDTVLPEARYVHIHRNGLDVVDSAMKRWRAPLDLPYIWRKARYVPISDMPYYAMRYATNRLHRLLTPKKHLAFWGPQLDHMDELLARHSLAEVCAIQWRECVEKASSTLAAMPDKKSITIAYEEFVTHPHDEMRRIIDHFDLDVDVDEVNRAVSGVVTDRVGAGRANIVETEARKINELLAPTLGRLGYATN